MELTLRGKDIYGSAETKKEMIERLKNQINCIRKIPDDVKIDNNYDDYIYFYAEPKDKDDRKYLQKLGFRREEMK
tara:strand:- start:195 stop:419 length:225 start_codon:yes stop_codon:yes gene_type:complete